MNSSIQAYNQPGDSLARSFRHGEIDRTLKAIRQESLQEGGEEVLY